MRWDDRVQPVGKEGHVSGEKDREGKSKVGWRRHVHTVFKTTPAEARPPLQLNLTNHNYYCLLLYLVLLYLHKKNKKLLAYLDFN